MSSNQEKIVEQALRHTEIRLEDLEKNLSSLERRLNWFATSCAALASISFLYAGQLPIPAWVFLFGLVSITCAFLAILGTQPKQFHVRGHYWKDWQGHVTDGDDYIDVLISQAAENDQRIHENELELERIARIFRLSFQTFSLAMVFTLATQLGGV